jgi:BCD family chlorophyll transporter-like MFS transporter
MLQFGGLAIMPFGLILLQGSASGSVVWGWVGSALAFLALGAGAHITQTAGLALATDLATPATRHRVVALLYLMLLAGMVASALGFAAMLQPFSHTRLVQVVQSAALITLALNVCALWKQEARDPRWMEKPETSPSFGEAWHRFADGSGAKRLLAATALGTAGFGMQDILLEPYGGQVLHLPVASTTRLTALTACGALAAFGLAARRLSRGADPARLAAGGLLTGVFAFAAVIFAWPLGSALLFQAGAALIGFGGGLFSVSTLTAAMSVNGHEAHGLALGAWGAVQSTSAGFALASGSVLRDLVGRLAQAGTLGIGLNHPAVGYSAVYHLEVGILFAALAALGPLARPASRPHPVPFPERFGLAELPD